jgi:hypothetical protein
MTDEDRQFERSWHLDKKVPIALIVTIAIQTAGIVWFAAGLFHRVETLERDAIATRVIMDRDTALRAPQADRLTRVEVKIETVQEGVTEIKRLIQRQPAQP